MSNVFLSHVATVTATATVMCNNTDLHVDATSSDQQTLTSPTRHLSLSQGSSTPHKKTSASHQGKATFFSSSESLPDFNFNSTAMMSSSATTNVCSPSDLFYNSAQGSWGGNTGMDGSHSYWQSELVVGNSTYPEECGLYESTGVHNFGNYAGCSGTGLIPENNNQHNNQWPSSYLDSMSSSSAYSGWYWHEGGNTFHSEGGPTTDQHTDPFVEQDKQTDSDMKYAGYDLGLSTDGHTNSENVDAICTDSQNIFALSCLQSPGVSLPVIQEDSSVQNDIFHGIHPFQENVLCAPSWSETDIDNHNFLQTYTTSSTLSGTFENTTENKFQKANAAAQKSEVNDDQTHLRSLKNKESDESSHTQYHSNAKCTISKNRGSGVSEYTETGNSTERIGLHISDMTSCSFNDLPWNEETLNNQQQQQQQKSLTSNDIYTQSLDRQTRDFSEEQNRLSQQWPPTTQHEHTQHFFSEVRDVQYHTMQLTGKSVAHVEPSASTIQSGFQSSQSPLNTDTFSVPTQPSATESSHASQSTSSCTTTTGVSEDLAKTPGQPPKRASLSKPSRSPVKAHSRPVSPSESSSSSSSSSSSASNAQSLIDVDHLLSSGITVAGFKPRPIIRKKPKVMTPSTQKDGSYWHKRKKNNDSAKRSREAKKEKEKNFYRRALELEYENYFLKERLGQMEAQLQAVTGVVPGPHQPPPPLPSLGPPGTVPIVSPDYGTG